jgi:hypothetical protein
VPRFRLRFAFQEIDLAQGTFVVGRAQDCHLTIDDPLVSRQHASIRITARAAFIGDAGSRNGVFVNGKQVQGEVELHDGDRIRIGPQELVFGISAEALTRSARATGSMCYCRSCGVPFAIELSRCPSCGSREHDSEPATGGVASDRGWGLELAADALRKAASRAAWEEAERLLGTVRHEIDRHVKGLIPVDREVLEAIADTAVALAAARAQAGWAHWILSVYAELAQVPASRVSNTLSTLPPSERSTLIPAARRVMESVETSGGPRQEDLEAFRGFESLFARLSGV